MFNVGSEGIFMAVASTYPASTCGYTSDNPTDVELTQAFQGTLEFIFNYFQAEVVGFNSQFPTVQDLYTFLGSIGITVTPCSYPFAPEQQRPIRPSKKPTNKLALAKGPVQKIISKVEADNDKQMLGIKQIQILGKSGETLEYTISHLTLLETGCSKEYELEISVKSNVNTKYLAEADFDIQYNTDCFGTNLSANNKVDWYVSTAFSNSHYSLSGADLNSSTLSLQFVAKGPFAMTNLTTSNQVLLYLHIPVVDCKKLANFKIVAPGTLHTAFASTPTSSTWQLFASITYPNQSNGVLCNPTITQLSGTEYNAGRGEILTIDGCDFGTTKGTILMNNPDINTAVIALDKYDITQWNNDQIKIRIPSQVDSGNYNGGVYNVHPVGTGSIIITTTLSTSNLTPSVTIKSAVDNASDVFPSNSAFYKNNVYLFSANTDSTYHFKLNDSITDQGMIDCIKAAFRRWRCTSYVSIVLDDGTTSDGVTEDYKNVITFGNLTDANAETTRRVKYGCASTMSMPFVVKEMDIQINKNHLSQFYYDTTGLDNIPSGKIDFFQTILHELGHVIGLQHTLNTTDLMYPSTITGASANDRRIILKNNDLEAANYIVNHSTNTPNGMNCQYNYPIKLHTEHCGWNNGLEDLRTENFVSIFPNPFSHSISVSVKNTKFGHSKISIFNILGEEVFHSTLESRGNEIIEFDNLNLKEGIYIVRIVGESRSYSRRMICTE